MALNGETIMDAVGLLLHLFRMEPSPRTTDGATTLLLDATGDQIVDESDAVRVLRFLFASDLPPILGTRCLPMAGCGAACRS